MEHLSTKIVIDWNGYSPDRGPNQALAAWIGWHLTLRACLAVGAYQYWVFIRGSVWQGLGPRTSTCCQVQHRCQDSSSLPFQKAQVIANLQACSVASMFPGVVFSQVMRLTSWCHFSLCDPERDRSLEELLLLRAWKIIPQSARERLIMLRLLG